MKTVLDSGVTVFLPEEEVEDNVREQLDTMGEHEAFDAETVKVMPDTHWGKGATIGFTMPIQDTVVPNVVGVDIGCGMSYAYLDGFSGRWNDNEFAEIVDERVRERIPMGFNVRGENSLNLVKEIPWDDCERKLESLSTTLNFAGVPDWFEGYGEQYFKDLCGRIEYDQNRAISSLGTLGGGNHFIEIGQSDDDEIVVTIHSGSRGIGSTIAGYWQQKATEATFQRNASVEIPDGEAKYLGLETGGLYTPSELSIDREAILEDYEGEAIEGKFGQVKSYLNAGKEDSNPLDYLEGEEAIGYYIDMIFAQTYASVSRRAMMDDVLDIFGWRVLDRGESVHNYIDFEDGVVRKGATRVHEGEKAIVPFNMRDGTIVIEGKGNPEWNYSAPHGAGRVMSRTKAKNEIDLDTVEKQMDGIATTVIPLDEAPDSYKDHELIEEAIDPTAEIVDRVRPLHNIKADD